LPKVNRTLSPVAADVLADDDVGAGLTDAEHAGQVELPADGDAPIGKEDIRDRLLAHADVDEWDDLPDLLGRPFEAA
jgi:hypothetical protein